VKHSKKKATHKKAQAKSGAPIWLATITELGRVVNLKERRLYQLRHEGLPRKRPGVYDVVDCCRWYVRFLQRKIAERANPPETSATAAVGVTKNMILSIESEMKRMQLTEKREQLISVEKVQKDLHAIVAEIRRCFGELPKKIAAEVVGETDLAVSQVKVDRALKGALEGLSQFDPDEPVEAVSASAARSSTRPKIQ
jgi:hypothetical protein